MKRAVAFCIFFIPKLILSQSIPAITFFEPSTGNVGSKVNIFGSNFNPNLARNAVYFGGAKARVIDGNSTQLTVIVPAGSTYEPITVTNTESRRTAYSLTPFSTSFVSTNNTQLTRAEEGYSILASNFIQPSLADIDQDGKTDVIIAYTDENGIHKLNILRNLSTVGGVSFDDNFSVNLTTVPLALAIGDLNGDGKLDIAVRMSNNIAVFPNNSTTGNIILGSKTDIAASGTGNQLIIREMGGYFTFNTAGIITNPSRNEGRPDLITFDGKLVKYIDNISANGSLLFAAQQDVEMFFSTNNNIQKIAVSDIDTDGRPDVIATEGTQSRIRFNEGLSIQEDTGFRGSLRFTVANVSFALPSNNLNVPTDIDGDGKLDLINWKNNNLSFDNYRSQSSKNFLSFLSPLSVGIPLSEPNTLAVHDVSGDGKPDFIFARRIQGSNPFGNFKTFFISPINNNSAIGAILFANNFNNFQTSITNIPGTSDNIFLNTVDIDGNNKPDVLISFSFQPSASTVISFISFMLNYTPPLAPSLTSFTPPEGTSAGNPVTISGSNFVELSKVSFNGISADYTVNSPNQITATVPSGNANGKLVVSNPGGSDTASVDFVAIDPAGNITGKGNPCQGDKKVLFVINSIKGASAYEWTLNGNVIPNAKDDSLSLEIAATATGTGELRVRGVYNTFKGSFSPTFIYTIQAIPVPPANLKTQVGSSSSVSLTWEDKSNNEIEFFIYRARNRDSSFVLLDKRNKDITTYTDNFDIQPNTTYYYRVAAANGECLSAFSNIVGVTTPPPVITSLSNTLFEEKIIISPNPSDGIFEIKAENFTGKVQVLVADALGKIVFQETAKNGLSADKYLLDLKNIASGIYFLNIKTERSNITKKIIKQ